jgi:hypothetical protein
MAAALDHVEVSKAAIRDRSIAFSKRWANAASGLIVCRSCEEAEARSQMKVG